MAGKTGSGKTVFEKWWLSHWYAAGWPIVVVDIKRKFASRYASEPELAALDTPYNITEAGALVPGCQVQIYHPHIPGWQDSKLNRLLLEILAKGNTVLAMDEVKGVANEHSWPLAYELIMTQGRQSNIPTINCFQKPVGIPTDLLEQSEWFAVFRVNNPDYRKRLVELTGFPEVIQRPAQYYYWLANENWEEPVLMAPVPIGVESSGPKAMGTPSSGPEHKATAGNGQSRRQLAISSPSDKPARVG